MKKQPLLIVTLLALLVSACSDIKVTADQKPGTDFSRYTTYQLIDETDKSLPQSTFDNEINRGRFETELEHQLENRNLLESENPDVYITYALAKDTRKGYSGSTIDTRGPGMWGRRGYYGSGMGTSSVTVNEHSTTIGQLTIAIVEAETDELLWYTSASGEIKMNMKNVDQHMAEAVEMLMTDFPINQLINASDGNITVQ